MKQLMGVCCKSTFVVLLVLALSSVAMAQFGRGPNRVIGGNTNVSGCGIGGGNAGWSDPCSGF